MAWSTPKTWSAEPLTSADLNTYIRDNQNDIRSRQDNNDQYLADESADYTTTATSFVDVDGTNMALTLTTRGGDALVGFTGSCFHSSAGASTYFDVDVDGFLFGNDDGLIRVRHGNALYLDNVSFVVLVEGLAAGVHTFKLKWKVSAGTATLSAGAATPNLDLHPQFWVQEL